MTFEWADYSFYAITEFLQLVLMRRRFASLWLLDRLAVSFFTNRWSDVACEDLKMEAKRNVLSLIWSTSFLSLENRCPISAMLIYGYASLQDQLPDKAV